MLVKEPKSPLIPDSKRPFATSAGRMAQLPYQSHHAGGVEDAGSQGGRPEHLQRCVSSTTHSHQLSGITAQRRHHTGHIGTKD